LATFGDMLRCYNECDVFQLADILEAFRNTVRARSGLDPVHYVGFPRLSLDTMLLRSGACVELIHELNGGWPFMNDINANVRGGLCVIFSSYAAANNPLTANLGHKQLEFDQAKPTSWILPLDINALYPSVMTLPMPVSNYERVMNPTVESVRDLMRDYHDEADVGYMVVCDIWVDPSLHDLLDFAPAAKRVAGWTSSPRRSATRSKPTAALRATRSSCPTWGSKRRSASTLPSSSTTPSAWA
jgi:hypothetical protein